MQQQAEESDTQLSEDDGKTWFLQDAFSSEQECLLAKLSSSRRIAHSGDRGEVNEQYFIDFLRAYLPNRYTVEKAIVIDSTGAVSQSIDIVVFDRQYTPTLLDSDKHRYVPAEAVYAVFECKPSINKAYVEYAGDKAASVRKLTRTSATFETTEGKRAREPFTIIGGLLAIDVDWSDKLGECFQNCCNALTGDEKLDCVFAVNGHCSDTYDGAYNTYDGTNALAYFAFRLLSKLQGLGTAPAADWTAYAKRLTQPVANEEDK